jgi:quercetin dioxygenase-like cupin family protein
VSHEILRNADRHGDDLCFRRRAELKRAHSPVRCACAVLEGEVEITIAGNPRRVQGGEMILMPTQQPHALKALQRYKMILTMIRS